MDKVVITTLGKNVTQVKMGLIFQDSKFLCMERTFKSMQTGEPVFNIGIYTVTYSLLPAGKRATRRSHRVTRATNTPSFF